MKRIAVVGEIGSGKSHLAKFFKLPVFNADEEVSKIYKTDKQIFFKLRRKLPDFIKEYPVNKKDLFRAIIKNKKNIEIISKIVHPVVRKKLIKFLKRHSKKKAVLLDIPLYFENKIYKKDDIVIYISSKKKEIIKRLKMRKNFNVEIYKKIKKMQLSNEYKKKKSNIVIKNNFNEKSTKKTINMIKKTLQTK